MPLYTVRCPICGDGDTYAKMKEAAPFMECPTCARPRPRVWHAPNFTEDRLRMWKGPLGNGYSTALGERMPETRAERDRLAAKKGVEFVGRSEFLASNKEAAEAVEYRAHVDAGGTPDPGPRPDPSVWKARPDWAKDAS